MLGFSDHNPMVLTVQVSTPCGPTREIKRSSYFKANLALLKKKENIKVDKMGRGTMYLETPF